MAANIAGSNKFAHVPLIFVKPAILQRRVGKNGNKSLEQENCVGGVNVLKRDTIPLIQMGGEMLSMNESLEKNKRYIVSIEISGPYAMWTDPASGDAPVSYPAPTFSAVKGIFESIFFVPWADIIPVKVEICKPIRYLDYTFNYRGPLRKGDLIRTGNSHQCKWTILQDVCYKLYAIPVGRMNYYKQGENAVFTTNGAHAYQERVERLLKRGQCRRIPHLGCKEFGTTYLGELRENTVAMDDLNFTIPSFLHSVFQERFQQEATPVFLQGTKVEQGVLLYAQ